jgi:hypothetical protein
LKYTFKELLEIANKEEHGFDKEKYAYVVNHFFKKLRTQLDTEEPEPILIPRFGNLRINFSFVFKSLGQIYKHAREGKWFYIKNADRLVNALKWHKNLYHYEKHTEAMARVKKDYDTWKSLRYGTGNGEKLDPDLGA